MIISYIFGHKVLFKNNKWVYADNNKPIESETRKCPKCGKFSTRQGHDPCIANLKGVKNACCGHGVTNAYTNN